MIADVHRNLRQCERHLRASHPDCASLDPAQVHVCPCGRTFVHVHDDDEGCYWSLRGSRS